MVPPISLIAVTESLRRDLHVGDLASPISSVALAVCAASALTSLGDHGEALAGLAGARRLDRGVERQQVGLLGDGGDQLDDVADAAGGLRQLGDARVGLLRLPDRLGGDPARLLHLAADLVDRAGHLFGGEATDLTLAEASSDAERRCRTAAAWSRRSCSGVPAAASSSVEAVRHRVDDAADRGLEFVARAWCMAALRSAAACSSAARLSAASRSLGGALPSAARASASLLLGFHLLDPHEVVAERIGGAGSIADLVAAQGIRNIDGLVAVGEFEQDIADAAERMGDAEPRDQEGGDKRQQGGAADDQIGRADRGAGARVQLRRSRGRRPDPVGRAPCGRRPASDRAGR